MIVTVPPGDEHAMRVAADLKGDLTVSVCIPCRDEAPTIGGLVTAIRHEAIERIPLVDELMVVDDRSTDDSADVAADAGATVVELEKIHAEHGPGHGKGNVLWASLLASRGDLVVWLDADLTTFRADWIARLVMPMLTRPEVQLVKAGSERPEHDGGGGGRTTELVARPLISVKIPELAFLRQPLAGEYAGRREALERLTFVQGWGVEIAILVDIVQRYGPDAIAEADVGVRDHRHRSLASLSIQAAEVMATLLAKLDGPGSITGTKLRRPDGSGVPLNLAERPPVSTLRTA